MLNINSFTNNKGLWIEEQIKEYVNNSPDNNMSAINEKAWDEPLIGFSNGMDYARRVFRVNPGFQVYQIKFSKEYIMAVYKIIKLEPKDYYKCANIWNMEKSPDRTKKWYDELVNGNRITFVYTENDEFIGEGTLVFKNDDPDYTIPDKRIYLSRLIVKTEYRNKGIGGIIVDYLINHAKGLGYEEISLGVDTINLNARHLYERKGFTTVIFEGEDEYGEYVKLLRRL